MRCAPVRVLAWVGLLMGLPQADAWATPQRYAADPDPTGREAVRDAAIDKALAVENVVVRGVARPRLQAAATVCSAYEVERTDAEFRFRCADGGAPFAGAWGQPTPWTPRPDGAPVTGTATAVPGEDAVQVRVQGAEGVRVNTFRFSPDGMTLEVALEVPRLQGVVRYAVAYRAAPAAR